MSSQPDDEPFDGPFDEPLAALRCSFAAELRGDPLPGTAPPGRGFLLIEQPGPWGRSALTDSRLDPAVGQAMSARAVAAGLRALLIRRPGRPSSSAPGEPRRFAVVDARPGSEATRWGTFDQDADLLRIPLDASAGPASYDPFYLVCTHGRHDACCAIRGRPVAAALARVRPAQAWECSHVGGDRFAANLVAMPHGIYYGRATADNALEIAEAHERGEVVPRLLRGRTCWLPAAQAAQHRAREVYGDVSIAAFPAAGTLPLGGSRWQVRLRHDGGYLLATVVTTKSAETGLLTCHATNRAHPPRFEVVDLVEVAGPV
ncbi:MAG: sucrase ferredoxin [Actinomycetes bacterium]